MLISSSNKNAAGSIVLCRQQVLLCFGNGSSDDEGLQLFHQIIAVIGIDLKRDRLGKIQAEDAQNGLAVYHMAADAQIQVIGVLVCNIDEVLHIFRQAELNVNCFHFLHNPLLMRARRHIFQYIKPSALILWFQAFLHHLPTFNCEANAHACARATLSSNVKII